MFTFINYFDAILSGSSTQRADFNLRDASIKLAGYAALLKS